jgi:hypothetical protein
MAFRTLQIKARLLRLICILSVLSGSLRSRAFTIHLYFISGRLN